MQNIFQGVAKRLIRAALQHAAKKRELRYGDIKGIERGVRRHFHDDITVIVIYLDHASGSSGYGKSKDQSRVHCTSVPVDIATNGDNGTD